MDRILEGIDNCDVSLLLEANEEFEKGYGELIKSVSGFLELLKPIEPMSEFAKVVSELLEVVKGIETDVKNMPEKYSFTTAYQAEEGGDSPEAKTMRTISSSATNISMYINGLKDAIIAVAGWLEGTPEIFSVGKNGIVILPEFAKKNQGEELNLASFSKPSGDEILQTIAEEIKDGPEQTKALQDHFKEFWNSENKTDEAVVSQAWEKFVTKIGDIGSGGAKAFQEAENAIKNVKPDEQVSDSVEKKSMLSSILGSIFGGSKPKTPTPSMGDMAQIVLGNNKDTPEKGLWACNFEQLQQLVSGLLAMAESANAGAAAALAGINSHNENKEMSKEQEAIISKLDKIGLKGTRAKQVAAAIEESTPDKSSDLTKIDIENFKTLLDKVDFEKEEIDKIIQGLEISSGDGISTEAVEKVLGDPEIEELRTKAQTFAKDRMKYSAYFDIFREYPGELVDFESDGLFSTRFVDDVLPEMEDVDENAETKEVLKKYFTDLIEKLEAADIGESTYRRWGQLAGIITS